MKARSLFAVALAASLAPAAAAPQGARARPAAPMQALSIGGFIGYEVDDLSGISLRADGEVPFMALSPQVNLSWVGSLGFSHLTDEAGSTDFTANIVKIVPAARFSIPMNPQLTLFADGGLGLYYSSWTIENPFGFEIDDSEIGLIMRIGGGAWYEASPSVRIGALLEFDPYFGDVIGSEGQTTFLIQAGAMFRL